MSWIDVLWPMMAGASLALALIHLSIWLRRRERREHLLFVFAALAASALGVYELAGMRTAEPEHFGLLLRHAHVPLAVLLVSLVWMVRLRFNAGRLWLAWLITAVRVLSLVPNFLTGVNLNFLAVTAMQRIDLPGDALVYAPLGVANPWAIPGQISNALIVLFVLDVGRTVWRRGEPRGERKRAAWVCGATALFLLLSAGNALLVSRGVLHIPMIVNPAFVVVLLVISYELATEVVRGAESARQFALAEARHERETGQQRDQLAHLARVASLGEMSASLAHELNQPLTAILSNAQAALRLLQQGGNDDEVRAALVDIVQDDRRASEVIQRLRAMLRKEQPKLLPLDLDVLVQEVARLYRSDLLNRRIALELALAPDLPPVRGDRVQLQQVLLNLLINAADAMVHAERRAISIATGHGTDDTVRVTFCDTGPGIPPGESERVFEPFVSTKSDGLGLGLAVCRTIVHAHGGRIWAENAPGGGACFRVELPVAAA